MTKFRQIGIIGSGRVAQALADEPALGLARVNQRVHDPGAASATPLWIQQVHEPRTDDKTGEPRHARKRRKMRASARN